MCKGALVLDELLHKNITKTYKATASEVEKKTNSFVQELYLDDRINVTAKQDAFIALKGHKLNFANNPTCRLINPTKTEIGKIGKQTFDRINKNVTTNLKLDQWKNTSADSSNGLITSRTRVSTHPLPSTQ